MKLLKWLKNRPKQLGLWDLALLKWATVVFTLFIAKLFPVLLSLNLWIYLGLAILLSIRPAYSFYFKHSSKN